MIKIYTIQLKKKKRKEIQDEILEKLKIKELILHRVVEKQELIFEKKNIFIGISNETKEYTIFILFFEQSLKVFLNLFNTQQLRSNSTLSVP